MKKHRMRLAVTLCIGFLLCACGMENPSTEKIRDLEYTVVEDEDLPAQLMEKIEEHKTEAFKLTYQDEQYLYVVQGYGQQETGGYSIRLKEFYLTEDAICFATELYGPKKEETVCEGATFPYIVVKTEKREECVLFR